ncbi:MAG: RCC1 repeat-containing protein, partial [Polyangiaceae bacterium]|nr:RCC1 repeat-containing protein [Polyangiaceae bacterium]
IVSWISSYGDTTCVVRDSAVLCWGGNGKGQLGDGFGANRNSAGEVLGLGSGVSAVSVGGGHVCALKVEGAVVCWGSNEDGQLGDGSTAGSRFPIAVVGLSSGVVAVAAGGNHTCALKKSGGVVCWGARLNGQLGEMGKGVTWPGKKLVPGEVNVLDSGVSAISSGRLHSCAMTVSGDVYCWGYSGSGGGTGSDMDKNTQVVLPRPGDAAKSISSGSDHGCAQTSADGLVCWGLNYNAQLGGGSSVYEKSGIGVSGLGSGVVAVSGGNSHTCAILDTGMVMCWGSNRSGQLGTGDKQGSKTPVFSSLRSDVLAIAAGASHTCALMKSTQGVMCWGSNKVGQLGDGTTDEEKLVPVSVVGL